MLKSFVRRAEATAKTGRNVSRVICGLVLASLLVGCNQGVEANVGSDKITSDEFFSALKIARGQQVLKRLATVHLIQEDARRLHIKVDDEELKGFRAQLDSQTSDVSTRKIAESELISRLLLRKILLKDTDEKRLRELYELFKEELKQYNLLGLVAKDRADIDKVKQALASGFSFEELSTTYSVNGAMKRRRGHLGSMTLAAVKSTFGPAVSREVAKLDAKGFTAPFTCEEGFLILKVDSLKGSYTQLRSKVQDLIVEADAPLYLRNLLASSKLTIFEPTKFPRTSFFDMPLEQSFPEEPPPEVDLSAAEKLKDNIGARVGGDLGVGIPNVKADSVDQSAVGGSVGAKLGLAIPSFSDSESSDTGPLGRETGSDIGARVPNVRSSTATP